MRRLFHLVPFLLLAAGAAGCGSKAPADSNAPPGVFKNPIRPDPEAIRERKLGLIDPRRRERSAAIDSKR